MELFNTDIKNAITALEFMIIDYEEEAIKQNSDLLWNRIEELKRSLNNFKLVKSIYGN
tara:strand:+ start:81 stop:254 length:174 start_codon:yes stop_codon:yes gene_type:complete